MNRKEYYLKNKEKLNLQSKIYKLENIDKILESNYEYKQKNKEKLYERFECECGGTYLFNNKARHFKTLKHQRFKIVKAIFEGGSL